MNKLLATLVAGAFAATTTLAVAQTSAPAPATTTPPASTGSMNHDNMKAKPSSATQHKKSAKKKAKHKAVVKEDKAIKANTSSANSAVKSEPATGGAAMSGNTSGSMSAQTKGK